MANVTVTNTADLLKAVSAAKSGDTIFLAPGTYSGVFIHDLATAGVTITSADPSNHAILTDMTLKNCSGLTVSNLEMTVAKDTPYQIVGSSNIVFDKLDVHGSLDGTSNDDTRGMIVRDSSNVTISNSHFHELTDALSHLDSQYVTITGNSFDTIRDDGIIGGGTSHIVVSNNSFTNFDHVGDVHPDAIQFGTGNAASAATDITISGNVYTRGTGVPVQGIWINDEIGTMPYSNVTVQDNVILGAVYNGIVVSAATDATVTGNTVLGTDGQTSWCGVRNVAEATVSNNITTYLTNIGSNTIESGNVAATALSDAVMASFSLVNVGSAMSTSSFAGHTALTATDAASVKAAALAAVDLLGYYDGPSTNGPTYSFKVSTITGTAGADRLTANAIGSSHLMGLDGNDTLTGNANGISSTFEGGKGDDTYIVHQANDVIVEKPGEGTDWVYSYVNLTLAANVERMSAMCAGLTLHGNALDNMMAAWSGGSTLYGEDGNDTLVGAAGNDILFGGNGNDTLNGNDGNDQLSGNDGNDVLNGGNGNDALLGGNGNDTLTGGPGLDVLTGGKGADVFLYRPGDFNPANVATSKDVITDFNAAEGDKIDIHFIDANVLTSKDDAFTFIGNQPFHGVAGELRYAADGDGITVYGDTNGDKIADLAIHLSGVTTIAASSFML
jgi:Ca2+-binding RTX toxin-like protein